MIKNSFLLTDEPDTVKRCKATGVEELVVATRTPYIFKKEKGVTAFKLVERVEDAACDKLFLPTLNDEGLTDAVVDKVLGGNADAIVAASYSLDEIGAIDAKYHLSPVQLLHKLGLLDRVTVVGGVHLDRDDLDLMAQCNTPLILCPSSSMGYGYGFPHAFAYKRKLALSLGSGDNAFNPNGDMLWEARLLLLGTNCDMRDKNAISAREALAMIGVKNPVSPEKILF